jgi:hypothetical protein
LTENWGGRKLSIEYRIIKGVTYAQEGEKMEPPDADGVGKRR